MTVSFSFCFFIFIFFFFFFKESAAQDLEEKYKLDLFQSFREYHSFFQPSMNNMQKPELGPPVSERVVKPDQEKLILRDQQ